MISVLGMGKISVCKWLLPLPGLLAVLVLQQRVGPNLYLLQTYYVGRQGKSGKAARLFQWQGKNDQ